MFLYKKKLRKSFKRLVATLLCSFKSFENSFNGPCFVSPSNLDADFNLDSERLEHDLCTVRIRIWNRSFSINNGNTDVTVHIILWPSLKDPHLILLGESLVAALLVALEVSTVFPRQMSPEGGERKHDGYVAHVTRILWRLLLFLLLCFRLLKMIITFCRWKFFEMRVYAAVALKGHCHKMNNFVGRSWKQSRTFCIRAAGF